MSENNARRAVVKEKQILAEFLKLYKTFPCLWDQKHILYSNREARDRAYDVLLEKYKLYQENATQADVKKKIENMRCAYRRDHKKVLMSKFQGGKYKPHLWYYNLLTFLNENHDNNFDQQDESKNDESMASQYDNSYQDIEELEDSEEEDIKPKRSKMQSNHSSHSIYVPVDLNNEYNDEEGQELQYEQDLRVELPQSYIISNEAEAFGRTIGFQLKELKNMQRIFAEKLISDVIFQARLGQLNAETTLSSNND